jgi:hypothetical protein
MITIVEAQHIARHYAKEQGELVPGVYLDVGDGETFSTCYYFDYYLVDKNGNTHLDCVIGGAPGLTVNKDTGAIKEISFNDLSKLED